MAVYKGKPVTVDRSAQELYARLTNLEANREMLEALPEDQRARVSGVTFTDDSISFETPGVGNLTFKTDKLVEPSLIVFKAVTSPIPLKLSLSLDPVTEASTTLSPSIDIEIPAMLRPFIGPKIQEAADKFGEMFVTVFAG